MSLMMIYLFGKDSVVGWGSSFFYEGGGTRMSQDYNRDFFGRSETGSYRSLNGYLERKGVVGGG